MLSEASMEWPLLLDGINVEYCHTVSVGSLTLQISLSLSLFKPFVWKSDPLFRSSQRRCSVRKGVLRKFAKFTGNHLQTTWNHAQICNVIKIETPAQVFYCEFCEVSKKTFLQSTSWRLLLPFDIGKTRMVRLRLQYLFLCRPDSINILINSKSGM